MKRPLVGGRAALLACVVFAGLASAAPTASAGLLKPQPLDAGTGGNAAAVGSALAPHQAWVGLLQQTAATGAQRLYAAYASAGRFYFPFAVDRGNPVVTGGLAGNSTGAALAVWTEKVGGGHVLFGRRLSQGRAGAVVQISASGQDANYPTGSPNAPFDRNRNLDMNAPGMAVLCYVDANTMKTYVALLAAGAGTWTTKQVNSCLDPRLDARGNVLLGVGKDANNKFAAFELINGSERDEVIDQNVTPMDEFSDAVGSGGTAMALGRDNNFNTLAYTKANLASSSAWTNDGPLEKNLIQMNANPEDPFAALDARGNGIAVFRDNSNNNPQGYYRIVRNGVPGSGGVLDKSSSRQRPAVDAAGNPFVAFSAADFKSGFLNRFSGASPGPLLPLAPGLEPYFVPSLPSIAVDPAGNAIVVISQGATTSRVYAVLGDFSRPTLRPSVSPHRPRRGQLVLLRSRAADDLADPAGNRVRWTLPKGVRGARHRTGRAIRIFFLRPGKFQVRVSVADPGGNQITRVIRLRVRQAQRRRVS